MIKIQSEQELIQVDIIEFITDKKWWGVSDSIKCNIVFTKYACKFTSKDVVITYEMLKQFNCDLKQLLNNETDCCLLTDQRHIVSLKIHKDKDKFSDLRDNNNFNRLIEFQFYYHVESDVSLSGFLFVNDSALNETIKEIEVLL